MPERLPIPVPWCGRTCSRNTSVAVSNVPNLSCHAHSKCQFPSLRMIRTCSRTYRRSELLPNVDHHCAKISFKAKWLTQHPYSSLAC